MSLPDAVSPSSAPAPSPSPSPSPAATEGQERFAAFMANLPAAAFIKDQAGRTLFVNRYLAQLFGLKEWEGKTTVELIPSEVAQQMTEDDRRALEDGPIKIEEAVPDGQGGWRTFETIKFPIRVAEGPTLLGGISTDITAKKRTEEALMRLVTAVEQAAESVVITDPQGSIVYVNPTFEKTTGYTRGEILGQNQRLLQSGRQDGEFYRQMWAALLRGEVWHGRFTNKRKDGTLFEEETTISPVRDAGGRVINYVALKKDVTREVQLEQQLRQAQKQEAIGRLAGGVAHDFNNILAATMLKLNYLLAEPDLSPTMREGLRELEHDAQRAASLTRQLLAFGRRSVLESRQLDLNEVLAGFLKLLTRLLGEPIHLSFQPASALPPILADKSMLEQVVMNLAVNARDAMPEGGRIQMTTQVVEVPATLRTQAYGDYRAGRFVCLAISDTGCGMDEATRKRLFEPFFTTKEVGRGTGLGLATVYGIVAQHKGWLEVESEEGRGSTFRVYLPALASAEVPAPVPPPTPVPLFGHETILVVEDDAEVRRSLVRVLVRLGYRVVEAVDGREARQRWREFAAQIDLLLTDMVMPEGVSGLDLATELRAEKPSLPVIISSGYTQEDTLPMREADAIFFLPKPYQVQQVSEVLRACLDAKPSTS